MLVVKTRVKKSPINGVGVFADENIPKGHLIYRFDPRVDNVFDWKDVQKMTGRDRAVMNHYAMKEGDKVHLDGDNSHFMNHSDDPNMAPYPDNDTWYATRDIRKGEEIVCDYNHFDDELCAKGLVRKKRGIVVKKWIRRATR